MIIRLEGDNMPNCLYCGEPLKISFRKVTKFCGGSCRTRYYRNGKKGMQKLFCAVCGKQLTGQQTKFCGEECKKKAQRERLYEKRKEEFAEFKEYKKPSPKKRTKPRPKSVISVAPLMAKLVKI